MLGLLKRSVLELSKRETDLFVTIGVASRSTLEVLKLADRLASVEVLKLADRLASVEVLKLADRLASVEVLKLVDRLASVEVLKPRSDSSRLDRFVKHEVIFCSFGVRLVVLKELSYVLRDRLADLKSSLSKLGMSGAVELLKLDMFNVTLVRSGKDILCSWDMFTLHFFFIMGEETW